MTDTPITSAVAADVASGWLSSFSRALASSDTTSVAEHFHPDGWWRDILALSWDLRTFHGHDAIVDILRERRQISRPATFTISDLRPPDIVPTGQDGYLIEAIVSFTTVVGRGLGVVRLTQDESGVWRAWTLMTSLQEITGHELAINERRLVHEGGPLTYAERRHEEMAFANADPDVLIVGAGQAGLGLAANLRLMGVPALLIEKNPRVGDNWRNRYEALVLHDPVWADALPFMPFPDSWPVYTPKDKLADWFESYVDAMELNAWTSVELVESSYSDELQRWSLVVRRNGADRVLHPRHLVMATGNLTEPKLPDIPKQELFSGAVVHSSQHRDSTEWAGKTAVVVGVCNSGADLARDLHEHGVEVTMLQRSPVYVLSQARGAAMLLAATYSPDGPPTQVADLLTASTPNLLGLELSAPLIAAMAEADAEMLDGLRARGFLIDDGTDSRGLMGLALERGGGFLLDVGSAQYVIEEKIGIRTGDIKEFTADGLLLTDGTELPADLVVLATGFKNMREAARRIFGGAIAERCNPIWGLDDEGELRAMWRPSGHPGFWFTGGSLLWSRIYSRALALQIVADLEGLA